MTGKEIIFLRKNLRLRIKEFAQRIGVQHETVSRWEKDAQQHNIHVDLAIRLFYATKKGLDVIGVMENAWPAVAAGGDISEEAIVLQESDWVNRSLAPGRMARSEPSFEVAELKDAVHTLEKKIDHINDKLGEHHNVFHEPKDL